MGIKAIPEIIVGPYPVGFDTIAFYVPNTLDWAAGKAGLLEMLGTAPLMYMVVGPGLLRGRGWGKQVPLGGLEKNVWKIFQRFILKSGCGPF